MYVLATRYVPPRVAPPRRPPVNVVGMSPRVVETYEPYVCSAYSAQEMHSWCDILYLVVYRSTRKCKDRWGIHTNPPPSVIVVDMPPKVMEKYEP